MDEDKIKEYRKNYYQEHKAKILERACEPVECEFCGKTVIRNNINKHYASKLCKKRCELNKMKEERRKDLLYSA